MTHELHLKEGYTLAKCCSPSKGDMISGYYSHNMILKVHKLDCENLKKAPKDRLVSLVWEDILADEPFKPDEDFEKLNALDIRILSHHQSYGVDYSLMVAKMLAIDKQAAFDHHTRLRSMGLLERVDPLMIQYRKGIVDNKWIKHRNHTYYKLTKKGEQYLEYYLRKND